MSNDFLDGVDPEVWRLQARFSHCVDSANKIEQLNATGGIAISFAPYRNDSVHLAFDGSQSKSLSIWTTRSKYGFLSTPKFKNEIYSVRFVRSGSMIRNNQQGDQFVGRQGRATLLAFDDMIEDRASADFSALTATVTRKAILLACEALEGAKPQPLPNFIPVVETSSPGMLALRQTLYALHRRFQEGISEFDLICPLIEEIIVYQIISVWPKFDNIAQSPALEINKSVRLALEYIESNLSKKITIAEIANISHTGVRSLQASFRKQVGCTPFDFIINRRLEQVRDALQSSDGSLTIRQIATQWGFTHMSDFGRRYRQRYGCAPKMSRSKR